MVALDRAVIKVDNYYACEIDDHAIKISQHNYPNIIRMGDVTNWRSWDIDWSTIDLVFAGFPCQSWSLAGKQLGDKDPRGMLFWTTLEIIQNVLMHNPSVKFLMENVKMKREFEEYITQHTTEALGVVKKNLINSSLVSAQNRSRYYWTNFEVDPNIEDKQLYLADILETDDTEKFNINESALPRYTFNGKPKGLREDHEKSNCLTASMHKGFGNDGCTVVRQKRVEYVGARATVQKNAEHTYNGKVPTLTASMGMGGVMYHWLVTWKL